MGWVYLDDRFPEHPKVIAAGDAAAWMFVCGLGYASRHGNTGVIPKDMVTRLTGARNAPALARRLIDVALWHDMGDHYDIHDYRFWNASQIGRTEKAKKAAEARWRPPPTGPPRDAQASVKHDAQASAEHMPGPAVSTCASNAPVHASASAPHALPSPFALRPTAFDVGVVETLSSSSGVRASDDDDDLSFANPPEPPPPGDLTAWEQTGLIALQRLAKRDLERREAERGPVGDEIAWLRQAIERRGQRHQAQLTRLDMTSYVGRVDALVELLEPAGPALNGAKPGPLAGSLATIEGRLKAEAKAAECGQCHNGWLEADDGTVTRCACQDQP